MQLKQTFRKRKIKSTQHTSYFLPKELRKYDFLIAPEDM